MKRVYPDDGMSLMQTYHPSNERLTPASAFAAMGQHSLQSKRSCYPDPCQLPGGQGNQNSLEMFSQQAAAAATGDFGAPRRPTLFSMQQHLPGMQGPVFSPPSMPYVHGAAHMTSTQMMPAGVPDLCLPSDSRADMVNPYVQQQQQQQQPLSMLLPPAPRPMQGSTTSSTTAAGAATAAPGNLLAQMRNQAAQRQQQQRPQQPGLHAPDDWRPMTELQRLLPRLNQEYKREMQLLLRACQVAGKVTRSSFASSPPAGILLDPAAREHVQNQVLSNCNDKHAAVIAAFRVAAQAVAAAAAASSIAAGGRPGVIAAAAAAVEVLGSSSNGSAATGRAAGTEGSDVEAAPEAVSEALQQLRSSYHQELVAATSALFAICRGFGQTTTMAAAASQPIKNALAAAQQQHARVEQLWQDVLLVAAGGRE